MNKNRIVSITVWKFSEIHIARQKDLGRLTATVFKIDGLYDPRYRKVISWMLEHDFYPVHHEYWFDNYMADWAVSDAIKERGWHE